MKKCILVVKVFGKNKIYTITYVRLDNENAHWISNQGKSSNDRSMSNWLWINMCRVMLVYSAKKYRKIQIVKNLGNFLIFFFIQEIIDFL